MPNFFDEKPDAKPPVRVIVIGFVLLALIGALDHLTGNELSFSFFYLIPVTFVTWYYRRWAGYFFCAISSITWLYVDYASGQIYSHWSIPIWNASVRLAFFVVTAHLLAELKMRLLSEKSLARTDDLTKLLNAGAFKNICATLLQQAKRHHHSSALAFIDLDNFKSVNDSLGHSEGDRVLRTVADTLGRSSRAADVLGRLGGDEFVIFMLQVNRDEAEKSIERIREDLAKVVVVNGWPIGFSIGVALFPQAPATVDAALRVADKLMYRVKSAGKNNVIYEEQLAPEQR